MCACMCVSVLMQLLEVDGSNCCELNFQIFSVFYELQIQKRNCKCMLAALVINTHTYTHLHTFIHTKKIVFVG